MPVLKLIPACKEYIWGGTRLIREFGKTTDRPTMAESWELSCHPDGPSVIANGAYAGQTLAAYIEKEGRGVLGTNCRKYAEFPILIKLIDAARDLSVQVHPDDAYALAHEGQYGKTEAWIVLDAAEGAFLYEGFTREITQEEFRQSIEAGTLTQLLRRIPVKKGDVLFIPAGTIHAICAGVLVAEVQQNSNVTYRVYDYGRPGADGKPRTLHIPQALAVTALTPAEEHTDFGGHTVQCGLFTVDRRSAPWTETCDGASFTSVLITDGEGGITLGEETVPCRKGDSLFIPAGSGEFSLSGNVEALLTRIGMI